MKSLTTLNLMLFLFIVAYAFSQKNDVISRFAVRSYNISNLNNSVIVNPANSYISSSLGTEVKVGHTMYNWQAYSAPYGRVTQFGDGTYAIVYSRGIMQFPFEDLGTAYNYFDGGNWGSIDPENIFSVRTECPSLARLGLTGEVVVAQQNATTGLKLAKRAVKGNGTWTELDIPAPAGASGLMFPRMVTGGIDHNTIHIIAITSPVINGGTLFNNQDGALIYLRSQDGGVTWDKNEVLPGLGFDFYTGFGGDESHWGGDRYSLGEPRGNTLAFSIADETQDFILMKSTDNGNTWQKTIIWDRPAEADTAMDLWSQDGNSHPVVDVNGKVHLVFGVYETMPKYGGYYGMTGGLAYWNEDMPTWTGGSYTRQMNCLNPDSLNETSNLIGYPIDQDGNGIWELYAPFVLYFNAVTSMPQLVLNDDGSGWVVMSGLADSVTYDEHYSVHHIYARSVSGFGTSFGEWHDLTNDAQHRRSDCVFPSICASGDITSGYKLVYEQIKDVYNAGYGMAGESDINFVTLPFYVGVKDVEFTEAQVSLNYPNPFISKTNVDVTLLKPAKVSITVKTITGQTIHSFDYGTKPAGKHTLTIDGSNLSKGIYILTVNVDKQQITRKIIK